MSFYRHISVFVFTSLALVACDGTGTLLDLYPAKPIVNPETGVLIQDNRLIYAWLGTGGRISGMTEKGGFTTSDHFRSFEFWPSSWFAGQHSVGFGSGLVAYAAVHGRAFVLHYSTDNGQSWATFDKPIVSEEQLLVGNVYAAKVVVGPQGIIWLLCEQSAGMSRRLLVYRVDVQEQTAKLSFLKEGASGVDVDFTDLEHGWLIYTEPQVPAGGIGVLYTTDGGAAWHDGGKLDGMQQAAITAVDKRVLLVYHSDGRIFRSADGGKTFQRVSAGASGVHDCQAANSRMVYALLTDGVAKSEDGGQTWHALPAGTDGLPVSGKAIYFSTERRGIVYGDDRLFVTRNGGESWSVLVYPYEYVLQ